MLNRKKLVMILSWTMLFLWMLFIFYLSSQVADESMRLSEFATEFVMKIIEKVNFDIEFDIESFHHIIRKCAHFTAYLILGAFAVNALKRSEIKGQRSFVLALLFCVLYAMSDEFHQLFVLGRSGEIKDVVIDSIGSITGIWIYSKLIRIIDGLR
ncbi:MAG: VanZ family protein [Clostridiales bacterium]|nr:VanZ family protein [Clostridiales bacterium]